MVRPEDAGRPTIRASLRIQPCSLPFPRGSTLLSAVPSWFSVVPGVEKKLSFLSNARSMLPSRDDIVLQTLLPCGPMRKRASVNHRCRAACSMRTFHKPHGERPRQTGRRTSAWKRPRGGPLDSPKWLLLTRTAPIPFPKGLFPCPTRRLPNTRLV